MTSCKTLDLGGSYSELNILSITITPVRARQVQFEKNWLAKVVIAHNEEEGNEKKKKRLRQENEEAGKIPDG